MTPGQKDAEISAVVFDVERYATEDGPGIRSVVFMKGCSLRCTWCQNPESHSLRPQVMYYRSKCIACRRCVEACPSGAIQEVPLRGFMTDSGKCTLCGTCTDACLSDARKIVGRRVPVGSLMNELLRDRRYYEESGGGVTFSGGEPLVQADATVALARLCRGEGIHTALETAGFVPWTRLEEVLPWVDLLYFDLKHIDSEEHRRYTGAPLDLILENLQKASEISENLVVRIPVIPGVNAREDTLRRMLTFLAERTRVRHVELLPFHRLGLGKYEGLGLRYAMADVGAMSREQCTAFAEIGSSLGLLVRVGAESG
jgi:pyruvate formate lyase activating enzyme